MANELVDIFSAGLDAWLRRGGEELSAPELYEAEVNALGGSIAGASSSVVSSGFPESSAMRNPVTSATSPADTLSGQAVGAILAFGKKSFADFTTEGWIQGLDNNDGVYKWLLGSESAYVDFGVSRANVLSFTVTSAPSASNAIFITANGNNSYPAVDIRRSIGTGSGLYINCASPSGYCVDLLQDSNTPALHIISDGVGSSVVPVQLENQTATSTNYYKVAEYRGGSAPAVSVTHWTGTTSPDGVLTANAGSICQTDDGALFVNTDGATAWTELTGAETVIEHIISTEFSSTTRTPAQVSPNATSSLGSSGISLNTVGSGATPYAFVTWEAIYNTQGDIYNANPKFSFNVTPEEGVNKIDTSAFYGGLGSITFAAASITFADNHIGFKIVRESGVRNLYATQGNGANEAVSSVLTTVASGDCLELIGHVTSGTSTTYYWRKNGGSLSAGTTLSTYMPTATTNENAMRFGGHCTGTNDNTLYVLAGASYRR